MIAAGVGQAGNQILGLTARYTGPLVPPGRKQAGFAFIDSEPKVVRPLRTPGSAAYLPFVAPDAVAIDQNGRGNNWAWGYTGAASHRAAAAPAAGGGAAPKVDTLVARAMAAIRRQAEAADQFDSLLLVHSLGGGTGSGLGSRVLELARDAYPDACLLSACIAPFDAGDTPLQWYNTALTLATAHEVADAVLLFDNADLLARAGRLRAQADALFPHLGHHHDRLSPPAGASSRFVGGSRASGSPPSSSASSASSSKLHVTDLNHVVAQALAGLVLPTRHRGRVPHTTRASQRAAADARAAAAGVAASGRPAWVSVAGGGGGGGGDDNEDAAAPGGDVAPRDTTAAPFHNPFSSGGDDGGGGGGGDGDTDGERHGYFSGDLTLSESGGVGIVTGLRGGASMERWFGDGPPPHAHAALTSAPFDALGLVAELVPAPAFRYIDVRSAGPLQPCAGGAAPPPPPPVAAVFSSSGASPLPVSWVDLAGMLADTLPRHDRLERRVVTLAATLVARGASQADCDAVDPALHAARRRRQPEQHGGGGAGSGGGGGGGDAVRDRWGLGSGGGTRRPVEPAALAAQRWRGLPATTAEWGQVALRLDRAQGAFSRALPPDAQRSARLSPGPVFDSPLAPLRQPRSLTLASNSSAPLALLERVAQRVRLQAAAGAYLHWYARFGISREHIAVAAESVADVADAYRGLL